MASLIPDNLKYTKDHEWAKLDGEMVIIGITDYAQSALGDIVFVELPAIGTELKAHQTFGVVESIKSVSDLFIPLSGKVIEVNSNLISTPEQCNISPYNEAWMIKIQPSQLKEYEELLSAKMYNDYINSLK